MPGTSVMALCGPGTPRNVRPTARARGLPDGVARCGSLGLLTWVSVTRGGAAAASGGRLPGLSPVPRRWPLAAGAGVVRVRVIKYDTCARTLYANDVPHRGAAVSGRHLCGLRGYGAAGSASAWHAEGQGFESP